MRALSSIKFHKKASRNLMVIIIKLSAIIVPFIAVYWQDLDIVFREALVNDSLNYILIIPFIIGYITYRKRKIIKAVSPLGNSEREKLIWTSQVLAGISLLLISFIIYFLGSYTSYVLEYHLLSLPFFVAGSIALVFNLETLRTVLFNISLLFFIQPYLIQLASPFWSNLSWISSTTAYNLLLTLGIRAKFTTVLDVPTIEITRMDGTMLPFTVGVASSGLNSLIGFTVFAIFVAYIFRESLWKKVTLMVSGYPLLLFLNTLRITVILSLAYYWDTTIAEIFHLTGGMMLIFIGTIFLLFLGEKVWKMRIFAVKPVSSFCNFCDESLRKGNNFCVGCGKILKSSSHQIKKQHILRIAFVIFSTVLLLLIQTPPIFMAESPTRIDLATMSVNESEQLLPKLLGWNLLFLYRDSRIERILKQDAALGFTYISQDTDAYVFVGVQISAYRHTWESSLIAYGRPPVTVLDLRDIPVLENPTLTARFFAFRRPKSNLTEVVLYWVERVPFQINSVWVMRDVQFSLWSRSDDLAKSGLISNPNDLAGVEKVYFSIAQSLANYWQPIKTYSQINAVMSKNMDKVTVATSIILVGMFILYSFERGRERRSNNNAYRKLSKPDKCIVDIVYHTEKTTLPTLNSMSKAYRTTTGENIIQEKLLQGLLEAEKIGILKSHIINQQDEPIQIWRTRLDVDKAQSAEKTARA